MKDNKTIAIGLRYLADLYFAHHAMSMDRGYLVRGFAFARAADSVALAKKPVTLGFWPNHCNGASVQEAIKDIEFNGKSRRVAALETAFQIPKGLEDLEALPGVTRPFLFVLHKQYGVIDKQSVIDALPKMKAENMAVYLRMYSALLADAQANTALNHVMRETSMGCSVQSSVCSLCGTQSGRFSCAHTNESAKPREGKS